MSGLIENKIQQRAASLFGIRNTTNFENLSIYQYHQTSINKYPK